MSLPPYDEANLSRAVGDEPAAVDENRHRLGTILGLGAPEEWCWLHQVHGTRVVAGAPLGWDPAPEADAAVTDRAGLPLVVQTADCAPIALSSDDALAVVHAGWSGLLAGVVEEAVSALRAQGHGPVRAALGPCVHPAHYEFGRDDLDRLVAAYGPQVESASLRGTPALDLPAAVRAALARVGVDDLVDVGVCTATSPRHFSHRRDGTTGRQALVAVLDR